MLDPHGRGDRGHRLERHARPRARQARRLRAPRLARPHRDRLVHGARRRDRRRAADQGHRARRPAHDPARLRAPRPALRARRRRRARPRRPEARRARATPATTSRKIEDGPWPAFPADLTSIAVALATQSEGSVLIFEKMFENRLVFTDKLVIDGRAHHPLRPAPRDRHRARAGCAASALESPDIRAGMAMLIAALCAEGDLGDRQHPPDRPRLRAHRRAPARARRADRAPGRVAVCRGRVDDPPDPQRDARRPARRDARAARDRRGAARGLRRARLRRDPHAGARVRAGADARRPGGAPTRPTGCSTSRATCSCCART